MAMNFFAPKEIKVHVKRWIENHRADLSGKTVVDLPAGNGISSETLANIGAKVLAFDLFPEFFRVKNLECLKADLSQSLPISDNSVDYILCQEGIEHVPDQLKVFEEFNRILKTKGRVVITTPNYSNLRSRLSYLFCESEYFGKLMPPNEVDSIWFAPGAGDLYFGHIYLIGIQKLRLFASLAGFRLKNIIPTKVNTTSLLYFWLYPFILYYNFKAYKRTLRKKGQQHRTLLREIFYLSINPKVLLENHLFVEFEKVGTPSQVRSGLKKSQEGTTFVT